MSGGMSGFVVVYWVAVRMSTERRRDVAPALRLRKPLFPPGASAMGSKRHCAG